MCSVNRSRRSVGQLVVLACVAGVLGFSSAGCSSGGGTASLSSADQAKAKETAKKKFDNFGETQSGKASR